MLHVCVLCGTHTHARTHALTHDLFRVCARAKQSCESRAPTSTDAVVGSVGSFAGIRRATELDASGLFTTNTVDANGPTQQTARTHTHKKPPSTSAHVNLHCLMASVPSGATVSPSNSSKSSSQQQPAASKSNRPVEWPQHTGSFICMKYIFIVVSFLSVSCRTIAVRRSPDGNK